jgi:DNA-binding GntR family transcriptional regulator
MDAEPMACYHSWGGGTVHKKMLDMATKNIGSQAGKAYDILKNMIMRGEIRQGAVLSILQLSEKLGIGRTPVSSACQRLEYDGLLRVVPKQGVWINTLSIEEALEIYESRATIETFFVRKALPMIEREDVRALKASIGRQAAHGEARDFIRYMQEDAYFHRYFMQKYANNTMLEMYNRLIDRIFLFGMKSTANEARKKNAIQEHRAVIKYLEKKDETGLIRAMEQHIMNGYKQLTGFYKL